MTLNQYREMLEISGPTRRDRILKKAAHDIKMLAPNHPSYKDVEIDGIKRNVNVISADSSNYRWIKTLPGEDIKVGSIVLYMNSHWLITERYPDEEVTIKGKIQICQKEIKWQDNDSLQIISRWATVEKPYYSNISENNTISYSTREFKIQTTFDEYSSKLNIGKRLMLEIIDGEPKTYKIVSVDQMTGRVDYNGELVGFLIFNVEQDLYNPETDNSDLMICDYIKENSDPSPIEKFEITFSGSPTIKSGGFGKRFSIDLDDTINENNVEWTIDIDPSLDGKIYFENKSTTFIGKSCLLKCEFYKELIGKIFKLNASLNWNQDQVELEVVDL